MKIVECFSSLQGESTRAGEKCFFFRVSGCNLRCRYCDTAYAWSGGTEMALPKLLELALASKCRLVEITGGEPLLQPDTPPLCRLLQEHGLEVMVETNGSLPIETLPAGVRRIVDCKLPDSGMSEHNRYENYRFLAPGDELKFVVSSRRDFDFALAVIDKYRLAVSPAVLLVSPVWGKVELTELAEWVKAADAPLKLQLQLHKLIWGDRAGV